MPVRNPVKITHTDAKLEAVVPASAVPRWEKAGWSVADKTPAVQEEAPPPPAGQTPAQEEAPPPPAGQTPAQEDAPAAAKKTTSAKKTAE